MYDQKYLKYKEKYENLKNLIGGMTYDIADEEGKKLVKVVTDKWDEKLIIAHEDQNRIDNRFIEQYYYKIELSSGNFLMANEYMTNTGRYLTQEDIDMADKRTFSYNKPKLFSEKGSCNLKAKD